MKTKITLLLVSLGCLLGFATQGWAQQLTAAACVSSDFKLREYDLAFGECASNFSAVTPAPVDTDTENQNRRKCRVARVKAIKTCTSRHRAGRALDFCVRAVRSERRACMYQARFADFAGPGPEVYRRDTCSAARSGVTEICFDYRERSALTPAPAEASAPQAQAAQEVVVMKNPTPTPLGCTSTCAQDCVSQYYEDYDYNAEQLCYYDTCGC